MENNLSHMGSAANISQRQREANQANTHIQVLADGILYRTEQKGLERQLLVGALVCVAWTGVLAVCILMGVVDLVDLAVPPALLPSAAASLTCLSISMLSLLNKKLLPVHYIFSFLATTAYLISATIFFGLKINHQWKLALSFTVIELIICILFMQNKRNIILVGLVGLQLIIIGLKLDNVVTAQWPTVFIIFMITALTVALGSIILAIYGVALRFRDGRFMNQTVGVLYQAIFQLGVALIIATVVCRVAYLSSSIYIGGPCIAYHILAILLFMYPFRMEIALYKAGAEIVSIIDRKTTITKIDQETTLYNLSSDWFTLSEKRSLQIKNQQQNNPTSSNVQEDGRKECVVCLTDNANLVWMPCGHLTLCESCGKYMLDNTKLNCVLCKTKGEDVYHLGQRVPGTSCQSDYHYQIRSI